MATHQGIEELLADFARIPTVHQPPPALNPLHMADCTPIASRQHSSRRHMDPNSNKSRSSSTRSNPSPVHVVQKEYSGTRRRNIFHPSMTPSEGSVSSTSGCAVKHHQESEHNESGAATGATSSLALSSSAAPSLSNSNHYGVASTAVGAATVSSLNGVGGAATAPPTACSSPHVFIVPSVLEHHFVGAATTREQSSDTFLPFGDLGSFAPPLSPLHTFYDADEQFSDDSQHCADDDEDGFALYTEDLAAFRTWRKQSAAQNELQTRHHFLSKLMFSSLEQRSRSVLMEFEFSERTHARNKFLDVISSEPPSRGHGPQGVAGPVATSSSPPTSHPSATTAAMTMASSLLSDQKAAIQSLAGQLGTVLKSVNAIQHQRNVVSEAQELSQQHFHHILGKFMRLCHREARDRQRVCQEMHEAFGDIVASHHHTVVARLCLCDAAAQQQNHNSHNSTVLADSTSTNIRQSVDVEVQRMSMVLAVQLAEAKSSFEAQLRHQHDVEHRAYRNEIDEKLAVRRKAELQLREEIARLKCLLASAYGTIDPPNMPSLDQELHQLPSFHAKVQQEVERTLRASASTANQSTVYTPPPSLSQHTPLQGYMFPQPSLTEMPSFLAPTDLSTDAPNAAASASSGPRQTGMHLYLLSAPDAPLSPGTENLADFSWQS